LVRRLITAFVLLSSTACPALSASLFLSPVTQTIDEACVVYVGGAGLVSASGLDIEITWDSGIVECISAAAAVDAPVFDVFRIDVDNEAGRLEAVLVDLSRNGFTGSVDSLLVLTFEPVSRGTAQLGISDTLQGGDPVLVDRDNIGIDIGTSPAEIVVEGVWPMPPISEVRLQPNYPNPFNPGTTVMFDLPKPASVRIRIYDPGGRLVKRLIEDREYPEGRWEEEWDGRNESGDLVPSGIYFCVLEAAGRTDSRKMVVLR